MTLTLEQVMKLAKAYADDPGVLPKRDVMMALFEVALLGVVKQGGSLAESAGQAAKAEFWRMGDTEWENVAKAVMMQARAARNKAWQAGQAPEKITAERIEELKKDVQSGMIFEAGSSAAELGAALDLASKYVESHPAAETTAA